jgi:outer membrane protein OmpA-like peptidoglycan-associated protein
MRFSKNSSVHEVEDFSGVVKGLSNTKVFKTGEAIGHVDYSQKLIVRELHNPGEDKSGETLSSGKLNTKSIRSRGDDMFHFADCIDQITLESGLMKQETLKRSRNDLLNSNEGMKIHFGRNSKTIPPECHEALERVARSLSSNERIVIRGYTDSSGNYEYNVYLSKIRAELVKEFFVERGVNPENVETCGLGPMHPIQSNDTPSGREANRRVEIEIRKPL